MFLKNNRTKTGVLKDSGLIYVSFLKVNEKFRINVKTILTFGSLLVLFKCVLLSWLKSIAITFICYRRRNTKQINELHNNQTLINHGVEQSISDQHHNNN